MKSSYPRLRAIRPTRCNPILTDVTLREIAKHSGAYGYHRFKDKRGDGWRLTYLEEIMPPAPLVLVDAPVHVPMPTFRDPPRIQSYCAA